MSQEPSIPRLFDQTAQRRNRVRHDPRDERGVDGHGATEAGIDPVLDRPRLALGSLGGSFRRPVGAQIPDGRLLHDRVGISQLMQNSKTSEDRRLVVDAEYGVSIA